MAFIVRLGRRRLGAEPPFSRGRGVSMGLAGGRLAIALVVVGSVGLASPALAQQTLPAEDAAIVTEADLADAPSVLAQFTTGVENREPIDQVTFVGNEARKVYFFTDLRGLEGRTIVHRWLYGGKVMAEVEFEVRGPRWRVWSSKDLLPDWIGDWTVEIVVAPEAEGEDAEVIAAESFTYSAPEA